MQWVEARTRDGQHDDASAYIRDLIQQHHDAATAEVTEADTVAGKPIEPTGLPKHEFLSAMSHELRTPLNAILGFGQLLESNPEEPLTEAQTTGLAQIMGGGRRLIRLIDEILDLAKVEAGQLDVETDDVLVADIVEECREQVAEAAAERKIKIITQLGDNPTVRADRDRFKQVVLNLMQNAVKHNRQGGMVHVTTTSETSGMLCLRVLDTGVGIPDDRSEDVFRPFVRLARNSGAGDPTGAGVGLSLSRHLIGTMGGNMGFESVPEIGTNFWIELPQADRNAVAPRLSPEAAEELFAAPRGTVVYIEDNQANLDLMKAVFNRFPNAELEFAEDASRGLTLIDKVNPDLVLLDIDLPGMNGFEALARLRETPKTSSLPVIAVSASALLPDVRKGFDAGFNHYVTKPFDIFALARSIRSAQRSSNKAETNPSP